MIKLFRHAILLVSYIMIQAYWWIDINEIIKASNSLYVEVMSSAVYFVICLSLFVYIEYHRKSVEK